jgi:hypothetical protein
MLSQGTATYCHTGLPHVVTGDCHMLPQGTATCCHRGLPHVDLGEGEEAEWIGHILECSIHCNSIVCSVTDVSVKGPHGSEMVLPTKGNAGFGGVGKGFVEGIATWGCWKRG